MIVTVDTPKMKYALPLEHKITMLCDETAKGKTAVARNIGAAKRFGELRGFSISVPDTLLITGDVTDTDALTLLAAWRNYRLCVIDGDDVNLAKLAKSISAARIPFILIGREVIGCNPVHYDAVYNISRAANGAVTTIAKKFKPRLELKLSGYTVIEDSGLGFEFYRRVKGGDDEFIITANGYGNVANLVNKAVRSFGSAQVIADASTFGACFGDIECPEAVTCFLPECFEEVLLNSRIFKHSNCPHFPAEQSIDQKQGRLRDTQGDPDEIVVLNAERNAIERISVVATKEILNKAARELPVRISDAQKLMYTVRGRLIAVKQRNRWHVRTQ
jgi:hypothetical protein